MHGELRNDRIFWLRHAKPSASEETAPINMGIIEWVYCRPRREAGLERNATRHMLPARMRAAVMTHERPSCRRSLDEVKFYEKLNNRTKGQFDGYAFKIFLDGV